MAAAPEIKAKTAAFTGLIPAAPDPRPVAAESRELARARAAASETDRLLEWSRSAAVSSR